MREGEVGSDPEGAGRFGSIREAIDWMARARGEAVFLVSPESGRILSFAGLREQSQAIATLLLGDGGLERGDKVAFLMDNGLFTVQLFLGTMYAGLVSVPLNVRAGVAQLASTLGNCEAKMVFVDDQYRSLAEEALGGVGRGRAARIISADLDSFASASVTPVQHFPWAAPARDDPALLMYSSGSVGRPKAAIHTHRTLLAQGRNSILSHQLTDADCSLLVLPLYHINAECVTLIPTLMSGGSVVAPHHFSVSQFWDLLEEHRCTWSAVVPTIVSQLLDWPDPRAASRKSALHRIRFLRSSSAPLSPSLHREFLNKFELPLIQAMGSTEAGNIFANPQPPGENKIGSPGLAWGFETRIVSRDGADVPAGEPGEILIRGPGVMQGYFRDPDQTAAILDTDGWLHTGDLAYQDQDGYFFVVGRAKELIIKGGMNIAPRQIDEVLESHPAVLEAAAVGVPDRYMGEDLIAFVVLRAQMKGDEREMLAFCESRLGHFKTPTRIHFVPDLPKGPSGKVQRLHLLDNATFPITAGLLYETGVGQTTEESVESTIEQTIGDSWAGLLKQARVDQDSNFFSLGGDSLTALRCLSKLREKLPVALSLADFFENPTVAQQSALVRQRLHEAGMAADGRPERSLPDENASAQASEDSSKPRLIPRRALMSTYPLSPRQQRLWFIRELAPGVPHYNESEAVRLRGELRIEALQQALDALVARHEVLRTTFQSAEAGVAAVVHPSCPLRLKQIDLTGLPDPQREAEVERLLIDEPRRFYNLESEPGVRVTLLSLGAREHVFILMMHHIICDRWSINVLWRELAALYQTFAFGKALALPPLPVQHGDYAAWQRQRLAETGLAKDLAYWEDALRGAPQLLELPADRPRPPVQSHQGLRRRFRLERALAEGLHDRSRQEKTSLFNFFAAALYTLIYRYTGSEDLVLGIPIADREGEELQSLVGFLVDTHALRIQLSGDMSFRELLARVQSELVAVYTHREAPFDQIVSRVHRERNLSHGPLYQVVINGQSRTQRPFEGVEGLAGELLVTQTKTSKSDLTIYLGDAGEGHDIWLEVEYSTDLFDEDRIARMCGHYQTLLASVAADPSQRLSDLPILTAQERRQVLYEWNNTQAEFPKDKCIHELFEAQVERTPDAPAVVFEDSQLTYRELNKRANQLAHHLRELGVGPDMLVAICIERSLEMVVGLLAILKAGGAYVPLDPDYPVERLRYMLEDSAPAALLTQTRFVGLVNGLNQGSPVIDLTTDSSKWADQPDGNPDVASVGLTPQHLAYVIYTSGSTGKPKGVMVEHRALVQHCWFCCARYQLNSYDRVLLFYSISFDPSVEKILCTWLVGAGLVLVSTDLLVPQRLWAKVRKHRVSVAGFPPHYWQLLLDFARTVEAEASSPLRILTLGGDALNSQLAEQTQRELPRTQLFNVYGPTEAVISSTSFEIRPGHCRAEATAPIGRPITNTQIYILDRRGQPAPIGVAGELHIGGIGIARGYLNQPVLTQGKFVSNPFSTELGPRMYRTGDLARYLSDGNIEFLGRIDHQVKIRGFRIELEEIEAVLRQLPGVDQCVVVALEDEAGDKRLAAYIVPLDPHGAPSIAKLRELLSQKLPEYMVPAAYVMLESLPLSSNGKLDRKALPAPEANTEAARVYDAPEGETETALAEIWGKLLKLDRIGRHDNFFELGGHSLLAVRVIDKINQTFRTKLGVGALFLAPTIEGLVPAIEENQRNHDPRGRVHLLGSGQIGPPLYFIGASAVEYRLAELVGSDRTMFAVELPIAPEWRDAIATGNFKTLPTVEQLGVRFGEIVRTHAGSAPCVLVGYSFWGKVAFEAAHALIAAGGQADVMLIDAYASKLFYAGWREVARGAVEIIGDSREFGAALLTAGRVLWWALSRRAPHFSSGTSRVLLSSPVVANSAPAGADRDHRVDERDEKDWVGDEQSLMSAYPFITKTFNPRPLDARGMLIRARRVGEEALASQHLANGWGDLFAQGLDVIQVSGNHLSLVRDPANRLEVARAMTSALDRHRAAISSRSRRQMPQFEIAERQSDVTSSVA
jgi:amino acid adenylation domain-containing protein